MFLFLDDCCKENDDSNNYQKSIDVVHDHNYESPGTSTRTQSISSSHLPKKRKVIPSVKSAVVSKEASVRITKLNSSILQQDELHQLKKEIAEKEKQFWIIKTDCALVEKEYWKMKLKATDKC